jgi:hypothetical protein
MLSLFLSLFLSFSPSFSFTSGEQRWGMERRRVLNMGVVPLKTITVRSEK